MKFKNSKDNTPQPNQPQNSQSSQSPQSPHNKTRQEKRDDKKKEPFDDNPDGIISLVSVQYNATDTPVTWQEQMQDYFILFLKYLFLVTILTLNFLGLSVSLNCNADQELSQRVLSAIFAFFFGFVYLVINYYTYKVLTHGKICKMDRTKLFPFKV